MWRPATDEAGYQSTIDLLQSEPGVTAIFAANDIMAIGALGAARALGLSVPEDLSIVGYDNTALAHTRFVNLTTIDDDSYGVGREAGRLLKARMAGEEPVDVQRTLTPSIVIRNTTAPPRA